MYVCRILTAIQVSIPGNLSTHLHREKNKKKVGKQGDQMTVQNIFVWVQLKTFSFALLLSKHSKSKLKNES